MGQSDASRKTSSGVVFAPSSDSESFCIDTEWANNLYLFVHRIFK